MKSLLLLVAFICWATSAAAQERGAITGRVVSEGGKPLVNINVNLSHPGQGTSRSTTTDTEGRFQFNGLADQTYSVSVTPAQGYLLKPVPVEDRNRRYRPSDNITFTLVKGGVITGRVTDLEGNPVIGIPISLFRVIDDNSNKIISPVGGWPRSTDDQGVYRIYGLQPGTYIVAANPNSTNGGLSQFSPYIGQMLTFHPSATRDAATEVKVDYGTEATGIDIRFRGETGRTISGKVVGGGLTMNNYPNVSLTNPTTQAQIVSDRARPTETQHSFAFPGLSDGDYLLTATMNRPDTDEIYRSEPRHITVKGQDVTGLTLAMMPTAVLTGRIVMEKSPGVCDPKAATSLRDVSLSAWRAEQLNTPSVLSPRFAMRAGSVEETGEFKIRDLAAGLYRFRANLRNEHWFVKSITASRFGNSRSAIVADLVRSGLLLKPGERISGVTVTLTDGAASLSGKLIAEREGEKLPPRMRVHLLPAEPAAAENLLRYFELTTTTGMFGFANVAPGKYWLLANAVEDESASDMRPVVWDAIAHAKLRKEAEAAKTEIELKPCQRVADQNLKLSPPTK